MTKYMHPQQAAYHAQQQAAIDEGLRGFMLRVYAYMSGALALTGGVAWIVAGSEALSTFLLTGPMMWVTMLAPVAVAIGLGAFIHKMAPAVAQAVFWGYAAMMGASLSVIFLAYTTASVASAFFVTSITFLAMSIYGYTTKRDLGPIGRFLFMALIGLIVASIALIFFNIPMLDLMVAWVGVLIFAGLTAVNTQTLKNDYLMHRNDPTTLNQIAIIGALNLYLDFINLLLQILKIMGEANKK